MEHLKRRLCILDGEDASGRLPQANVRNHEPGINSCFLREFPNLRYHVEPTAAAISADLETSCYADLGTFALVPHGFTVVVGEIGETEAEGFKWTFTDVECIRSDSAHE